MTMSRRAPDPGLGQTVVDDLFGTVDPIGQTLHLRRCAVQRRRCHQVKGSTGFQDADDIAIAPITTVQESLDRLRRASLDRRAGALGSKTVDAGPGEIRRSSMPGTHDDSTSRDYQVLNQASVLQTSGPGDRVFTRSARSSGRDQPAGRRDRRDEHHVGDGHRADPRDRHPQGDRRTARGRARTVPDRGDAGVDASEGRRRRRRDRRLTLQDRRRRIR